MMHRLNIQKKYTTVHSMLLVSKSILFAGNVSAISKKLSDDVNHIDVTMRMSHELEANIQYAGQNRCVNSSFRPYL